MPIYKIQHITKYLYDAPVIDSTNQIKIYPITEYGQQILQHEIFITGEPNIHTFIDYWGNKTGVFTITEPHVEMTIESRLVVAVDEQPPETPEALNRILYLDYAKAGVIKNQNKINEIIQLLPPNADEQSIAGWCMEYVYQNFSYEKGITTIETTVDEILTNRKGVCQDFAHVLLQMLRTLGIPARYVSGYICPNKDGLRGEGATHAWVEVWLQNRGWCGIDPTNNIWVTNNHIRLAVGRNFKDCTPVKGTFKGMANQKLNVYVSVGYEDGHVFEEHTQVVMSEERVIVPAIIPKQFFMQQQQQQ